MAILSLAAGNTIAINTVVTGLDSVALAPCSSVQGLQSCLMSAQSSCGEQQVKSTT